MYIEDRLFSESYPEEVLFSVTMTEDEYELYSEFQKEFGLKDTVVKPVVRVVKKIKRKINKILSGKKDLKAAREKQRGFLEEVEKNERKADYLRDNHRYNMRNLEIDRAEELSHGSNGRLISGQKSINRDLLGKDYYLTIDNTHIPKGVVGNVRRKSTEKQINQAYDDIKKDVRKRTAEKLRELSVGETAKRHFK